MANFQVIAVRKHAQAKSLEYITHIAYYESVFNARVIIPVQEAIRRIELNKKEFYVRSTWSLEYVEIASTDLGTPIIRTKKCKRTSDHLLGLQNC